MKLLILSHFVLKLQSVFNKVLMYKKIFHLIVATKKIKTCLKYNQQK